MGTAPAQGLPSNNSCCPLALALWSICRAQHRSSGPPQCPLTHESFPDEEKRVQDPNRGPAPGPRAARLRGAGLASRPARSPCSPPRPGWGAQKRAPAPGPMLAGPSQLTSAKRITQSSAPFLRGEARGRQTPGRAPPSLGHLGQPLWAPGSLRVKSPGLSSPYPPWLLEVVVKIAQSLFARKP